jgi:hypothetical protein
MASICISHKKINEIKDILFSLPYNEERTIKEEDIEEIFNKIKDALKYNSDNGSYVKKQYEITKEYRVNYYQQNKEKIKKQRRELYQLQKLQKETNVESTLT